MNRMMHLFHPIFSSTFHVGWSGHLNDLHHRSANCVCRYRTDIHRPEDPEREGCRVSSDESLV